MVHWLSPCNKCVWRGERAYRPNDANNFNEAEIEVLIEYLCTSWASWLNVYYLYFVRLKMFIYNNILPTNINVYVWIPLLKISHRPILFTIWTSGEIISTPDLESNWYVYPCTCRRLCEHCTCTLMIITQKSQYGFSRQIGRIIVSLMQGIRSTESNYRVHFSTYADRPLNAH